MFSFQHTEYLTALLILIPLGLLFITVLLWKKKVRSKWGDAQLVDKLTPGYSSRLYKIKFILVLAALALAILAMANLRKPSNKDEEKRAGIDIMIALDVSKSMLSQDVKPTRLDRAKQCLSLLIDALGDNRVGLTVFAGRAYLQMPLTSDAAAAKMYLSNATPDAVPVQGTVISQALKLCDNSLDTKEKKYKAVILLTDGEDHDEGALQAAQQLYDHGVVVYTVGIGTAEGAPIIEPGTNAYKTDINGQPVITKLNEVILQQIAKTTGGDYFHLDNSVATANAIYNQLNGMDKKYFEAGNGSRHYASFFPLFIALSVIILVIEIFVPETKKTSVEK